MGFCFGVKRAVEMATEAARRSNNKVYSLGHLIHNPQEVERLRGLGIEPLQIGAQIPCEGDTLIVRAHGAPPEVLKEMRRRGVKIVDTTCPIVEEARRKATILRQEGYQVIIVGDKDHPEVKGILGCVEGDAVVVKGPEEVEGLKLKERVGLLAQTTESVDQLSAVASALLPRVRELKVFNTICRAVMRRQKQVEELAKTCDLVVVVGGKGSANTRRLAEIARRHCNRVYHIETPEEVDQIEFPKDAKVGVSAGTSTPKWVVDQVVERLRQKLGEG